MSIKFKYFLLFLFSFFSFLYSRNGFEYIKIKHKSQINNGYHGRYIYNYIDGKFYTNSNNINIAIAKISKQNKRIKVINKVYGNKIIIKNYNTLNSSNKIRLKYFSNKIRSKYSFKNQDKFDIGVVKIDNKKRNKIVETYINNLKIIVKRE